MNRPVAIVRRPTRSSVGRVLGLMGIFTPRNSVIRYATAIAPASSPTAHQAMVAGCAVLVVARVPDEPPESMCHDHSQEVR